MVTLLTTKATSETRPAALVISIGITDVIVVIVEVPVLDVSILCNRHVSLSSLNFVSIKAAGNWEGLAKLDRQGRVTMSASWY